MRIGLTYDLRNDYIRHGYSEDAVAEFDSIETIDAIETALGTLGANTSRIGSVTQLVARLACGDRWDLVFNIAEGTRGFGREAQVPALLEAFDIPYTFSDPLTLSLTLHKAMAKRVVRDCGIATADFYVVERLSDVDSIDLPFPLFAKPVAEGTSKGVTSRSKARSRTELRAICGELLEKFRQPVLVETFLPGREFTVGVLGTGADAFAVGAMEIVFSNASKHDGAEDVYAYDHKTNALAVAPSCVLASDADAARACKVALDAWRALGCRDGGRIDVRFDTHGRPCFIEANPLAGLKPSFSDLPLLCEKVDIQYATLIRTIVSSASRRMTAARPSLRRFVASMVTAPASV